MKKSLLFMLSGLVMSVNAQSNCPELTGSYTCSEITEVFDIDGNRGRESNSDSFQVEIYTKLNDQNVPYTVLDSEYGKKFSGFRAKSFFTPFHLDQNNSSYTSEHEFINGSKAVNTKCILDERAGKSVVQDETFITKDSYNGRHLVAKKRHFMRVSGDVLKISTVNNLFEVPSELMADLDLETMYEMSRFNKEALVQDNIFASSTTDQINCVRN